MIIALALITSCSTGSGEESTSADSGPGVVEPGDDVAESGPVTTGGSASATTTSAATSTTTSTTSTTTTTTTTPEQGATERLCTALRQPGFETRRTAVATFRAEVADAGGADGADADRAPSADTDDETASDGAAADDSAEPDTTGDASADDVATGEPTADVTTSLVLTDEDRVVVYEPTDNVAVDDDAVVEPDIGNGGSGQDGIAERLANEACPAEWARVTAASDVAERSAVALSGPIVQGQSVVLTGQRCDVGAEWSVRISSFTTEVVGMSLVFALMIGDEIEVTASEPVVVRGIVPGEERVVTAPGPVPPSSEATECSVTGNLFLDDRSPADASLEEPTHPELTGDHPAEWFPHLYNAYLDAAGSGDPTWSGVLEDVRSHAYADFEAEIMDESAAYTGPRPTVAVCAESIQRDGDVITFVYQHRSAAGTEIDETGAEVATEARDGTAMTMLRQGADGQWRWLGNDLTFKSERHTDCGPGVDLATL